MQCWNLAEAEAVLAALRAWLGAAGFREPRIAELQRFAMRVPPDRENALFAACADQTADTGVRGSRQSSTNLATPQSPGRVRSSFSTR